MNAVTADGREPHLKVVAGSPTPDELAVVIAVLSTRGAAREEAPAFSLWARKSRQTRPSLRPGFGAWRASMMPR
jgi:Acyl-CoA carboxylase epsilon subunit